MAMEHFKGPMEHFKGLTNPKVGLRGLVSEELFLCLPNRNVNFTHIDSMASAPSTPTKFRGEVDTSKPYHDVREAIQMFDHGPESVKNSAEKRVIYESPVVGGLKEQLAQAVAAKEKAEHDKERIEKELSELRAQVEQALKAEDDHSDLTNMQSLYDELVDSRKKVELLESQITASNLETEEAVKQAGLAESSAMSVHETMETATLLHEEDEAKLLKSSNQVESLRLEISGLSHRIFELQEELERSGREMSDSKTAEARALALLGEATAELRALEAKLKQSEDERNTLQATHRYLEPELESTKAELEALRNQEEEGEETYRAKIKAAEESEARSRELEARLLAAFGQVSAEAIEAEVVKDAVNGEIEKLREETGDLRLQGEAAERQAVEVLQQVVGAKAGEAEALEAIKGLAVAGDGELDQKIHRVEDSSSRKIAEADAEAEAARVRESELKQKLEDARAEIDASRAQVKHANDKAASAEAAKSAVEGELRRWRSDSEQRRKLAFQVVGVSSAQESGVVFPDRNGVVDELKNGGKVVEKGVGKKDEKRLSTSGNKGESLAEVLQINLPTKQEQNATQKKKLKLLARLGAVFTSKKKQPSA